MNKETLIENILDKHLKAAENTKQLTDVINNDLITFDDFDDQLLSELQESHYWEAGYFDTQAIELKNNFSIKRCQHLIEVKDALQKRDEKGFTIKQSSISQAKSNETNYEQSIKEPNLDEFIPSAELSGYIKQNSTQDVRSMLEIYLNDLDFDLTELIKSIYYVHQKNPDFFDAHKISSIANDFDLNQSSWNWEYFNLQQVFLNRNFSLERILHLVNVRQLLSDEWIKEQQPKHKHSSTQSNRQFETNNKSRSSHNDVERDEPTNNNHFFKVALMVGGAVLAALALIISISR